MHAHQPVASNDDRFLNPEQATLMHKASVVSALKELLSGTILLRNLYKAARTRAAAHQEATLRSLFDESYRGQLRLVDLLIDTVQTLGDDQIFFGDLLPGGQQLDGIRIPARRSQWLRALAEAHNQVLSVACLDRDSEAQAGSARSGDAAVAEVVLENEAQLRLIEEQLASDLGAQPRPMAVGYRVD